MALRESAENAQHRPYRPACALLLFMAMASTSDRKSQLITAASANFEGLARKDFAAVPWSEAIAFRSPLAPEGAEAPLIRRDGVLAFFTALGPNLGEVRIVSHFLNEDLTAIM